MLHRNSTLTNEVNDMFILLRHVFVTCITYITRSIIYYVELVDFEIVSSFKFKKTPQSKKTKNVKKVS